MDAPADPAAFLVWAEERLGRFPEPAPAPTARPTVPRWRVGRLVDAVGGAIIDAPSGAPHAAADATPLATVGSIRSDAEGATVRTRVVDDRKLGRFVRMTVGGFAVECDEVGSIVLEVRLPFGRHVELSWSPYGFARLPLPDNTGIWTLRLATDGLADWKGTLRSLEIRSDGIGDGAIEVRSLAFYGHREAYPAVTDVVPVTRDGTRRRALYMRAPATVTFPDVAVPARARLAVGLGRLAGAGTTDVAVDVTADGERTRVLDRRLAAEPGWQDASIDLTRWQGGRIAITLAATNSTGDPLVFWADPTVYEPVEAAPLVVLYLIDTLSAEHIDLYGHARPTMPHLGSLARAGAWFEHMYANSPVTVTSIAQLMLSLPIERHGAHGPSMRPPAALVPLAEVLQQAGFATLSMVTNVNAGPQQGMDRGFDAFIDRIAFAKETEADRTVPIPAVSAWIERHADRPMFVYLHTAEPHAPYLPRAGFAGRFDPDFTGQLPLQPRSGFPIVRSVRDLERARASYDEEVLYADDRLGAFLAALDRLGVRPRATILVTADHGEELNDHGAWGHGPSLYEEVLRTPLVVAGAGIPPSGRIARPAQLYDVMPTILELAGVALPYALEGESLVPLLRDAAVGARASGRPIVVAHHRFWARGVLEYAVIDSRRWKLVFRYEPQTIPPAPPSRFQLFDLKADPDETSNLVMAHPEVTRRLVGELLAYAERQPRIVQPAESAATLDYDPEQLEQLRALGYVE